MGQKIHPTGFRLAVTRNWSSRWYAGNGNFASMLSEDIKVRDYLKKKLKIVLNYFCSGSGITESNFYDKNVITEFNL